MIVLKVIAWILGIFGIAGTLIPFLRYDDWWIRGFDFPRVQLSFILTAAIAILIANALILQSFDYIFIGLIALALIYQIFKILPYTFVWKNQVQDIAEDYDYGYFVSLLMSNVLQKNERSDLLLERIKEENPDLILTLETNQRWQNELDHELIEDYPYTIKIPRENRYGMHLYSRFELRNETINHLISEDLPSIYTEFKIPDGGPWVKLYGVHPSVPSPTEEIASTERDGELSMVGKLVEKAGNEKTIVAGDLNDVAWSHSTRLFQRISGLLDPRRGRGFYATFHANYWFARWPLDHVFHSPDFGLKSLKRLKPIGSDHFPVFVKLGFQPQKTNGQQALAKQASDQEVAERTIATAQEGKMDTLLVDKED